jgi:hypothetical protein
VVAELHLKKSSYHNEYMVRKIISHLHPDNLSCDTTSGIVKPKYSNEINIYVMTEPWLRKGDELWVSAPHNQGVYDIYVHLLMLSNRKVWDVNNS